MEMVLSPMLETTRNVELGKHAHTKDVCLAQHPTMQFDPFLRLRTVGFASFAYVVIDRS